MVFFTCNACGSSVKKNQVEKHWQNECPNCEVLSCLDCGRDFHGDEYASHTKCISEAEKYQGALFKDSGGDSKGERKQQEWLERLRTSVSRASVNPRIARLLERIAEYPNIPRKKAKFENFVRNSCNVRDQGTLEQLWTAFSAANEKKPSDAGRQPVAINQPEVRSESRSTPCDEHGDVEVRGVREEDKVGREDRKEEGENGQERRKDRRKKVKDAAAQEGTDAACLEERGSGVDSVKKKRHKEAKHLENGCDSPVQATASSSSSVKKKHKRKKEKERDAESQIDPVPQSTEVASPRKHKKRKNRELQAEGEEETKKAKLSTDDASVVPHVQLEELVGPPLQREGKKTKKHKHKHH